MIEKPTNQAIDQAIADGETAAVIDLRNGNAEKLNHLSSQYPDRKDLQLLDAAVEAYWNWVDVKVMR